MTELLKICGGAIMIAVCGFLLRELGWRGAVALSLLGAALMVGLLADGVFEITSDMTELAKYASLGEVAKEILKILGTSYIFGFCSDICSELGEKTLSSTLLVVGRVEILLIVMPYFLELVRYATELVGSG